MDIHPSNDLHICKMKHENDSESEIVQLMVYFNLKTYILWSIYSRAEMKDNHPHYILNTCKMEHENDSQSENVQVI